ncbi:TPA: class I SAM-dependent methyltransferase family protein [Candidatus Woesearchaeota archaeon]|nr:class I SAM-dependent methyltransferase family protein [Candidatus Woesearchaeota archaeon]
MTLSVKIPVKKTQEVKAYLLENKMVDTTHRPKKTGDYIYIAVKKKGAKKRFPFVEYEDAVLEGKEPKGGLKERLKGKLNAQEMEKVQRAYDIIGDIAIFEVPQGLEKKEKEIAEAILGLSKNVHTVLKKAGIHSDEYRTIPLKWVAGRRTKETVARENKVLLKMDVEKVYYSPRSSSERGRIVEQVKPGEDVLVMFSGCGPFTCAISRNSKARSVVGVEKNPLGHKYEEGNILLNKLKNAKAVLGDVREAVPKLGKFDRILMPLPMNAEEFLDVALGAVKKGGVVHLYQFVNWEEREKLHKVVREACSKSGRKCRVLRIVKCGQFNPKKFRVCVDIKAE